MFIACQSFLRKFYKKRIRSSLTLYFILSNFIKKINPIFAHTLLRDCRITIDIGQWNKKRMKDRASSVIVELPHNNLTKGGHILHEQKYNTGHGVSAIPDEVCGKIRRQPCRPKVQQKPVVHLLLESPVGWHCGILGLSVKKAPQSPQSAHRSRNEVNPGYAPS